MFLSPETVDSNSQKYDELENILDLNTMKHVISKIEGYLNSPLALKPVTLYCPGPGPILSFFPPCLLPKLKAGDLPFFESDGVCPETRQ